MLAHHQNQESQAKIGRVTAFQLKENFQTPLYVIDQEDLESRLDLFRQHFQSDRLDCRVIYASKAFMNLYMAGLIQHKGLYLDVVSGGELHTALKAGVDPKRIYFHGNHKSEQEIQMALKAGIGCFVIDNIQEYRWISSWAEKFKQKTAALLRINPGIEAETHRYIQTTTRDSKFGISTDHPRLDDLIQTLHDDGQIDFRGFHCHVGSQVQDPAYFFQEAEAIIAFAKGVSDRLGIELKELNFGGGFGVPYFPDDPSIDYGPFLDRYVETIEKALDSHGLSLQTVSIEPGRSLINNSGYMLYTVGHVKETLEGLPLIFVDGGMNNNLRPALYQADYHAVLANKMDQEASQSYRVGGKLCESGDILIQQVDLPPAESGDLLLVAATGAYTYSMSSNYNMIERPAVVFVNGDRLVEAVQRQSYDDLIEGQTYFSER